MYEDPQRQPLLRLAWNRNDHNYIATFGQDSKEVSEFLSKILKFKSKHCFVGAHS